MRAFNVGLLLGLSFGLAGTVCLAAQGLSPWQETLASPRDWQGFGDWSATAWDGRVYLIGSAKSSPTSNQSGQNWVASIAPDGQISGWSPVSTSNIQRSFAGSAVAANGIMYTIGGSPAPYDTFSSVEYAKINADGTLGDWTATSSLLHTTGRAGAVGWGNHLYLVGGAQSHWGPWLATVQVAEIKPDGSLGPWVEDPSAMHAGHPCNAAVVDNGWIYSISGGYNEYMTATIERAQVLPDGSLSQWIVDNPLPTGVACHGADVLNDRLYVFGGQTGTYGSNLINTVWSAGINLADHSLGAWREETSLPVADQYSGVAVGNHLYGIRGYDVQQTFYTTVLPEPSTFALLGISALSLLAYAWRRWRRAR